MFNASGGLARREPPESRDGSPTLRHPRFGLAWYIKRLSWAPSLPPTSMRSGGRDVTSTSPVAAVRSCAISPLLSRSRRTAVTAAIPSALLMLGHRHCGGSLPARDGAAAVDAIARETAWVTTLRARPR